MKAAVVYTKGEMPVYADVPEPVVKNDDQVLISIKAAAIKHFDKSRTSGRHYSSDADKKHATIIGGDGVGILEDGTRIFALGDGMIAEKAIVEKNKIVPLPEGIDEAVASALPNAVAGSAMALRFRAGIKPGETVLINGATGFTGKIAVQIAKYYGAKKIIVTGRNEQSLQTLKTLGADEAIAITQNDEAFTSHIQEIHNSYPIDIVIDYLWGHPASLILTSLKGKGNFTHKTRFVSIGAVTGDTIQLSAENLRSTDIHICGSGLGSWTKKEMQLLFTEILPEMFQLAASGKLQADIVKVKLADIENLWQMEVVGGGARLVVVI